jgi:hypothetical protein
MRRRAAVFILLATMLWPIYAKSQQNSSEMDEQTKAGVKQLRSISQVIKACPRQAEYPDTGTGTFLLGPPANVISDVKPNPSSVRARIWATSSFSYRESSRHPKSIVLRIKTCALRCY